MSLSMLIPLARGGGGTGRPEEARVFPLSMMRLAGRISPDPMNAVSGSMNGVSRLALVNRSARPTYCSKASPIVHQCTYIASMMPASPFSRKMCSSES